ncbi:MAG: STAS domain-containing protein [Leptolyngbyaceae cyanobacterium bins.349]|nr:STAS domain-containing protein [Leptolyngbyaceae cyanobacterium bins.349]
MITSSIGDMITSCTDNAVVIQPKGRLDFQNGTALSQALCEICPNRHSCWMIDLSNVDFINSAGLTALINGLNTAINKQCRLVLCNPHPSVKLVFEITRLDELFEVLDTVQLDSAPSDHAVVSDLDRNRMASQAA